MLALALATLMPRLHAQEWRLERYTADEGLPQNTVSSLAIDPLGYVWALTDGGLVRFDGHTVLRVPMPAIDGGPQRLREIVDLQNGTFVIRDSRSRRFLLDHGRVSTWGDPAIDRDPYPLLRGAAPSKDAYVLAAGRLWREVRARYGHIMLMTLSEHEWVASTAFGLSHFRDTTLIGHVPQQSTRDRYFQIGNTIYATDSSNRPFRVDLRSHTMRPVAWKGPMPHAAKLTADSFDPWWQTNDRTPSFHIDRQLHAIRASANGDTLIATALGLELPEAGDLDAILVALDKGVVVVGTKAQGLLVYHRTPMRTLRCSSDGPGQNNIYYAQATWGNDSVLTMAGLSSRILSLTGCDTTAAIDTFNYEGIARDQRGHYWYAHDSLICCYDPGQNTHWQVNCAHGWDARPRCFFPEGDSVWVGLDHGIGCVKNGRFRVTYRITERNRNNDPYCIRRGPDGALWFATCEGIYRLDRTAEHATLIRGTAELCVRSMQQSGAYMYLGTYGSGPWVFAHDSLRQLPLDRAGYLAYAHTFMPDALGFLWISTNHGLFRVHQREIDAFLQGSNPLIYYAYYGKAAGIGNTEFNGGCDPPYLRLPNGYASFPSLDGLVWFRPEEVPDPYPAAPVQLDELLVNGVSVDPDTTIELAPGAHELVVRFSLAYWGDPANAQFVYRLPGVQDEWYLLPMAQRELRFQHLPHGTYELVIRKLGSLGHSDEAGVVVPFVVRRPFYATVWFMLLCGAALAGLGVLVLRLYQARLRKQNLQLTRMVRARTGELQAANERLHRSIAVKERLVSIISHDIVTPLRFIARVAHKVPQEEPEQHREQLTGTLHDIALSSDKLYMNARNLLNWIKHQGGHIELRPVHVALNPLVEDAVGVVARLAKGRDMNVVNAVPFDDVLLTDHDLLGIILQNLVNNALNHSQGSEVVISGEQLPDAYRFTVSDNGPGLPVHTRTAIDRLRTEGAGDSSAVLGLGYVIITELVRLMGGELRVEPGPGARITILLTPLHDAVHQLA